MEFRNNIVEFEKIRDTIDRLKEYEIDVSYITEVKENDTEIKRLLGVYKRTKKQSLKYKYGNDIERTSNTLGNKPITVEEFFKEVNDD